MRVIERTIEHPKDGGCDIGVCKLDKGFCRN